MTRLPTLTPKEIITALKRAGFEEINQTGSHLVLWHSLKNLVTVVAIHSNDLPRLVMKKIIKQAGLTEDEFRELL